jgi:hypothetical protein
MLKGSRHPYFGYWRRQLFLLALSTLNCHEASVRRAQQSARRSPRERRALAGKAAAAGMAIKAWLVRRARDDSTLHGKANGRHGQGFLAIKAIR